jgi:electron transfer flavoprotein beta subunit
MLDIAVLLSLGRHPASGRARAADRDCRALQIALSLADVARIHAIHAGDPNEPALRDYLGMGIDCLTVLAVDGDVFKPLTDHLARLRPAVVLTGSQAEWGEASGMLPYLIAQSLESHLVPDAVSITLRDDTARVIKAMPRGGRRALRVTLPLTLTVDRAAPEPRMSAYGPARRGRVEVSGIDPEFRLPPMPADWRARPAKVRPRRLPTAQGSAADRLRSIQSPRTGSGARLLSADAVHAAEAIWQYLVQEGLTEADPSATPVVQDGGNSKN